MSRVVLLIVALAIVGANAQIAETCASYCELVANACQGASTATNAPLYSASSEATAYANCLVACSYFPTNSTIGTGSAASGYNTLQCRLYHASVANTSTTAAITHCPHAAAGSNSGQCGTTCEAYCNIWSDSRGIAATSLGSNPFVDPYGQNPLGPLATCLWYCSAYPAAATTGVANPPLVTGDTAECRFYHANVAAMYYGAATTTGYSLATAHFGHSLPAPTTIGTCTDVSTSTYTAAVEVYCTRHITNCGTGTAAGTSPTYGSWATRAQCLIEASNFPRDFFGDDQRNNTLDCRLYHAGVSGFASYHNAHCPHSGANGINVCGTSQCQSYCSLIANSCTGVNNTQFSSTAQCLTWCAGYIATGSTTPYATSGPSFQCHFYHAQVAGQAGGGASDPTATLHCPHAGPTGGGGVCGTPCENFCQGQIAVCGTAQYTSYATCLTSCAAFAVGTSADTAANTLGCRQYHILVAATSAANAVTHCPHTSVTGGGVCVSAAVSSSTGSMMGSSGMTGTMGGAASLSASFALVAALVVAVVAL